MKPQFRPLFCAGGLLLALAAATGARAEDVPILKPGLWEMKMSMQSDPPSVAKTMEVNTRQCLGQTTEKEAKALLFGTNNNDTTCSKQDIRKTATGYTIDAVCANKLTGATTTTHTELTGDLSSSYTVKSTSRTEGGKGGREDGNVTGSAKRVGDCTAGWKPGDVEAPDGSRFNLKDPGK